MKSQTTLKCLLFLFFGMGILNQSFSQSYKGYKKLSSHEKCWVFFHPFKAKRAYRVSKEVERSIDSILNIGVMGNHHVGNQLDAFKHAFWMWSLAEEIGWRSARSLGIEHEKGNYEFFKEHKLEDGVLPDKISCEMDLHNNSVGLALYKEHKKEKLSRSERMELVRKAVIEGRMKMIYQTKNQQYIDSTGQIIPKEEHYGLWENRKCLVPSRAEYLMADNKSKYLNLSDQKTNR
ncbi:DUF6973 domain-containing protein [Wenyingzhuangia fucanilytica]|nr:hypothetical protein [Wenyingzhuangia fucanilytica]